MDQTFMKERKIIPLVLSMSLPMVLSMLVNSLYNIVDSYFVAKVSEDAMTALSLVYPVQIIITAISVGFGVGINAMIAYFLGAGDDKSANNATTLGMVLSTVHGLILTIFCIIDFFFLWDEFIFSFRQRYKGRNSKSKSEYCSAIKENRRL